MNERVQKLIEQAVKYSLSNVNRDSEFFTPIAMEKFAELIVRECADAAYQSLYEDRVFDDSPANIRRNVMDAIKKNFGVEE